MPSRSSALCGMAGVAASCIILARCADHNAFDPIVACSDSQVVTVHVDPGLTPQFTWTPSCGMASLRVLPDTGSGGGWVLYSGAAAADNPLPSGIRYGIVPPRGLAPADAAPLVRGVQYHVVVYRWLGPAGGPGSLFDRGSVAFTP